MSINNQTGKTTPSRENYLKVILELSSEEGIRSVDIANALGVSRASVSNMMSVLMNEGYVAKGKRGVILLTESGRCLAVQIKGRYELLKKFLHHVLGVKASTAAQDACRMEHLISPETAQQIGQHLAELNMPGEEGTDLMGLGRGRGCRRMVRFAGNFPDADASLANGQIVGREREWLVRPERR